MQRPFFLLCFLLWAACAHAGIPSGASAALAGTITAKSSGAPLAGAQVVLPDLRRSAISRADGSYRIDDLPATRVLVKVTLEGYATRTVSVQLDSLTTLDVALEASVTEVDEVVVTGTSRATELRKDPVPMALIDHLFLTRNATTNIIETLNKVPGVSTLTTGPNVSKPYIRGLGYNRVLTLFDGVRQEGQQWGDEHGIEVDQFLIDRIEVVKGPASLMYGSDALAGVVNLLPAPPVPAGTIKGSVIGDYGTNNKQIAGSFALDGNTGRFIWGTRFSHKQASDYQNKYDGRVFGTKYNENDLNAYVGVNRSWGYSHLNVSLFDDVQEIPDGSRDPVTRQFTEQISEADTIRPIVSNAELNSYTIGHLHQRVQHYRAYSINSFMLGRSRLVANIGYQRSIRREFDHPQYPELAGLYLVLSTTTYDLKLHLPDLKGWSPTVGVNGMYQVNDASKGTELVIPGYTDLDIGPFIHAKRSFGRLDLSAGARYDVRFFENDAMYTRPNPSTGFDMVTDADLADTNVVKQFDAYKHTFSGFSASGGAAYSLNEHLTLKANVARGYRAPNAAEIAAKGVHPGTGFEQLGDANFKPEFSLQEDLGLFFSSTHVSGSIEFFNNTISNYIYNEKLASVNGGDSLFTQSGEEFPVFKFRQTTAQLYGGEFMLDIHPHPLDRLHFENAISFIHAVNRGGNGSVISDSTRYLPFIPPFHTNSDLRLDLRKRMGAFSNLFVKVGVQYYAVQDHIYSAYGTETPTPGYTLLDAGVGGDVVDKQGRVLCSFTLIGSNLADVAYQSNMSRLKYMDSDPVNATGRSGIYNMGRNIALRITVPFTLRKEADPVAP